METQKQNNNEESGDENFRGLWQNHESYAQKAPEIISRKVLTPEEMAKKEGFVLTEMEPVIKKKVEEFSEHCGKTCGYPDYEYWPLLEDMYFLYLASSAKEYSGSWVESFRSFDSFAEHFCPEATAHARVFMKYNIQSFLETTVHPEQFLRISPDGRREYDPKDGFFESEGDWVVLPENGYGDTYHFVEEKIIHEVADLIWGGYRQPDYSHATGSSALNNIGGNGAILSSNEAKKENVTVSTGEFVSYNSGVPYKNKGLNSVYADRGGPRRGYHFFNWFDEHYISFGISKEKQDEFMRTTDFRYGLRGEGEEKLSADYGSEGVVIGHKVPLQSVEFVYCWKKHQKEMEEWKNKFCPQAKVISYEAASALSEFGSAVNAIAREQQIKPTDAWMKLTEKGVRYL